MVWPCATAPVTKAAAQIIFDSIAAVDFLGNDVAVILMILFSLQKDKMHAN